MSDIEQLRAISTRKNAAPLRTLSERLVRDQEFRAQFTREPTAALREAGVEIAADVELGPRDRLLLEMIADEEIVRLYNADRLDDLHVLVRDKYADLIDPGGLVSVTDVDFDVIAIAEVVVVAVVAVAAIAVAAVVADRPGELVNERLRRLETLNDARIRVLEAKIDVLESRLG